MNEENFTQKEYEEAFEKSFDEKQAEFDELRNKRLVISLIGSVNAGKSMTINALTGKDYDIVKARAGYTTEVSLYDLDENVIIADTPGLFDINEEVSQRASDFVEESADVILFFLNANAGITANDKKAFEDLKKLGKKIFVVINKIDTLEPGDIVEVRNQVSEVLNVDPFMVSAKTGEGIQLLNKEILAYLEQSGKDLLFLKISKFKKKEINNLIMKATIAAAGIGAIPIPGSDIIPLTALQVGLAMKIAFIYGIKPSKNDVMKIVASTVTGSIGKQAVKWAITALKALGWVPGGQLVGIATSAIAGGVAASMTYGFGWACNEYYNRGMQMEFGEVAEVFNQFYTQYKTKKEAVTA